MEKENKSDEYYALKRTLDKIYFSERFKSNYDKEKKPRRFAHKILDDQRNEYLLKDEITIGCNSNGNRQLKALFLEDDRRIAKLIIQQFGINNNVIKNKAQEVSFHGSDVERLYLFLKGIKEVDFPNKNTFNIKDSELAKMLINKEQATQLIEDNFDIFQDALKNNITSKDLINFGYRKVQLEIFERLLNEDGFFEQYKTDLNEVSNEGVWQKFFEKNTWILGYGLDYVFNSELESKKMEQITSGSNVYAKGKRTDALLKSLGAINSLCFCELKLSTDHLLKKVKSPYRGESWQISDSLSGAIAQVQRTSHKAIKEFASKTEMKDEEDNLTEENLFLYNPKSFILIGNLNEFIVEGKINEMKFSSFEMFRKNLRNIEILTYDELYQRAYHICYNKE